MITNFLNDRSMEKTKTVINFQLTKINEQLKKLHSLKEELEEKKKNIEYFENFSQFETPIIKEIDNRYVLYKKGNFKDEEEIDFELKKLKRLNFEDNDFIFTESEIGATIRLENGEMKIILIITVLLLLQQIKQSILFLKELI